MKAPDTITVNDLGPGTLTVTVKLGARLRVRVWLALLLMRVAGWILLGKGVEFKCEHKENLP